MKSLKTYADAITFNTRKFVKWILIGSVTGIIVGAVASAFAHCLQYATGFREANPNILFLLPVGGVMIVLFYRIFRYENNKGTDDVIDNIHKDVNLPLKMSFLIFISTVITIFFGGSVGREGAALQIGGSLGSQIGRWLKFNKEDKKIILMSGMAAAFSALFGTPIAAVFFPMEVASVGIMYYAALVPCICASLVAHIMAKRFHVEEEQFPMIANQGLELEMGIKILLLAICCAVLSILFCKALKTAKKFCKKYLKNAYIRAIVGGIAVILMTLLIGSRDYLGTGMDVIIKALNGKAVWYAFFAKMLFTVVTITAGYKGGEIVPSFFIGATFGCIFGKLAGLPPEFTASLGMVGVFCGVTNCPIASLLIGFELFGYHNPYYILVMIAVSYMLSGKYSLYHTQIITNSKVEYKSIYQELE